MEKSQPYYGNYDKQYVPTYLPAEATPSQPSSFGVPEKRSWLEESQRNKPQSNSLGAALFIFASGGMSLAWSVGFAQPFMNISRDTETHLQICWFVAVILGATISFFLIDKIRKRKFNLIASVLVAVNGILFLSASENIAAIIIARYCDGLAFGLTVIPAITAGSEQSVKLLRGLVLSIESVGISMGIMLQAIYFNLWEEDASFNTNQMHGALALLYGVLAFAFACFLTIESPSFYLRHNREIEAIECLRKLQRPFVVNTETYALLYENKKLVEEDEERGKVVNIRNGLFPLGKLILFRVLVSMSFSLPISLAILRASEEVDSTNSDVGVIFYGTLRSMGTMVAIFTLDTLGRKKPTALAMTIGGGLLIVIGSIYVCNSSPEIGVFGVILALLMTYQFLAGFVSATSTVYLGEAFSISVKPLFILITLVLDNIVQIIICCEYEVGIHDASMFCFILGVLQIVYGLRMYSIMPETKKTTLREALSMF